MQMQCKVILSFTGIYLQSATAFSDMDASPNRLHVVSKMTVRIFERNFSRINLVSKMACSPCTCLKLQLMKSRTSSTDAMKCA